MTTAAPAPADLVLDERIRAATRLLLRNPASTVTVKALAAHANISVSRFLHLFRAQTGPTFRRYRLWARMLRAAELPDAGHDLTRIAVESGLSSPSHLSSAFHDTFGLTPSRLLAVRLTILHSLRSPSLDDL